MLIKNTWKRKISLVLILAMILCMNFTNVGYAAQKEGVTNQIDISQPKLSKTVCNVFVGEQVTLRIKNKTKDATYAWSTSDKKIATVTQRGVVKGISKGTTIITCNITDKTDRYQLICKVTVIKHSLDLVIRNKIETLAIGQVYDFDSQLSPSSSNDKVTWSSSNPVVAKPDQNGKIKALSLGTTTITAKSLSGHTDSVRLEVIGNVVTARNQKDLERFLNSGALVIKIRTEDAVTLTIPQGDYSNQNLIVEAPNADITNYGVFASIDIEEIKANTWREEAIGNLLKILAAKSNIIIGKNASASIEVDEKGATLSIVNNGIIEKIVITREAAQAQINISGESKDDIPVMVDIPGIKITSSVPLNLECRKKFELVLLKGAEETQLQAASKEVIPEIKGNVKIAVKVGADDKTEIVTVIGTPIEAPKSTSSGGSGYTPAAPTPTPSVTPQVTPTPTPTVTPPVTPIPFVIPDLGIGVTTGSAITQSVTSAAITTGLTHHFIQRGYLTGDPTQTNAWMSSDSGPFEIHILELNPNTFSGHIAAKKCGNMVNSPVNSISDIIAQGSLDGAIAAVNGGFFMVRDSWGTVGASTSLSVTNGKITNEAIPNRPGLLIPNGTLNGISIGRFTTEMTVSVEKDEDNIVTYPLTGLNRRPGVKCGVNDDYSTHHDNVGYLPNDFVLYDDSYGTPTESYTFTKPASVYGQPVKTNLTGVEVAFDNTGKVTAIYDTMGGHAVTPGGGILAGIGTSADWLKTNVVTGSAITTNIIAKMDGEPLTFGPTASVMSAGPLLIDEGVLTSEQSWFEDGFQNTAWNGKNPRTLIGIRQDGMVLIVVVDGKSNRSRGATIKELQIMMQNLGCYNALNLDGGGSTMMTINNVMVDITSWFGGPRQVGDYLSILP